MSSPELHRKPLERYLRIHDEQITALLASKEAITREIGRRQNKKQGEPSKPNAKIARTPTLAARRDAIERRISIHKELVALGRDQRILDVLDEVASNQDLAREAASDPNAFAKSRGIKIPANMKLEADAEEDQISLRVTYYDRLEPFVLTWDRSGFSIPSFDALDATRPSAQPQTPCAQ